MFDGGQTVGLFGDELEHEPGQVDWGYMVRDPSSGFRCAGLIVWDLFSLTLSPRPMFRGQRLWCPVVELELHRAKI